MKKWKKSLAAVVVLFAVVALFLAGGAMYKQDIYDAAMSMERDRAGLEAKRMKIGKYRIAWLESKKGEGRETLVLVHGFGAMKENWLRFAGHLAEDYHVIAVDLPGHGESSKELTHDYGIESQADFLFRFANTLKLESFHLAGNSMGGAISVVFAVAHPELVKSLVLYDPAGVFDVVSPFITLLEEGKNPLIANSEEEFDSLIHFVMEKPPFIPWPVSEVAAEKVIANAEINRLVFSRISSKTGIDFKSLLKQLKVPVFVVWGAEDQVINAGNADIFVELIPNSSKLIYPGIGHLPMLEIPKQAATDFRRFVSGIEK
ncbi:MAG: alpha/beta hydrolase [Proteobacteria bacterium]|nr:MAG: alpha/beta hydrolase [Pseudomonadota bacterium]